MKRIIYIALLSLLVASMLIGWAGCRTVRKSQTADSSFVEHKSDTLYKEIHDTLHVTKTEVVTETKTEIRFDTAVCPDNKITYKASGDVEIRGSIKQINLSNFVSKKDYDSVVSALQLEQNNSSYYREESKKIKTKTIVKRGRSFWWLWLLIGAIGGVYVGARFKSILNFKVI